MGPRQTEYFRRKLIDWRQALLDESEQTLESMRDQQREVSDEAERASRETEMSFELRTRDRYRKLIRKINEALGRIEDGSYGFCEETGDPIGLGRLEARPIATPLGRGAGAPGDAGAPVPALGACAAER